LICCLPKLNPKTYFLNLVQITKVLLILSLTSLLSCVWLSAFKPEQCQLRC